MHYRPKKGVALISMCGEHFLFPSRSSGVRLSFIFPVPDELVPVLKECPESSSDDISAEMRDKLQKWMKFGLIEEY